jgi:hypothetical protein
MHNNERKKRNSQVIFLNIAITTIPLAYMGYQAWADGAVLSGVVMLTAGAAMLVIFGGAALGNWYRGLKVDLRETARRRAKAHTANPSAESIPAPIIGEGEHDGLR